MPSDIMPASGLATDAYARLIRLFAEFGHLPSKQQWVAIRDLMTHLELAANGQLPLALHLSSIPAGTGKSQSLVAFAGTLMDSPSYHAQGMIIFVNRITEAREMAGYLAPYRDKLCVITSDASVNALGAHKEANEAQVCIATQAALKATLKTSPTFDAAERFHYLNGRRAVVCWDESFAFNRPATLDAWAVLGLAKGLARHSPTAAYALTHWSEALTRATDEGPRDVPDFVELGVDFHQLEEAVINNDELVIQAKALKVMSGGKCFSTRGDFNATTLITHYPELPPSLMPLIVTDASASVNPSYAMMGLKHTVRPLEKADKTYRNMTIRIVPTAASRSAFRDKGEGFKARDLIEMAVRYIRSVAPENVLVVSYKGRMAMKGLDQTTVQEAIDARLTEEERWIDRANETRRVSHLTWGKHTATNDHKDVRHVLLMGLNYLPRPTGQAAAGAALDMDLTTEQPTPDQIEETHTGMLKDATLQAILRGNARQGVNGDCGVMEVVIPQVKQTGLSDRDYRDMFPEVVIVPDKSLMPVKPLKGRLAGLAAIVNRRLKAGEREMTNQSLYEELKMNRANFGRIVKGPEWKAYVSALGLNPQPLAGRLMGLRLVR